MNDESYTPDELGETPTIEVTVYRDGEVIHREVCESESDAAAVVERWNEDGPVECQIDDLSVRHRPDDVLEPTEAVFADDDT